MCLCVLVRCRLRRVRRTAGRDLAHNAARSRYAMRWYWASSYIAGVTRWSMHDVNQHVQ
jgi:hypothetical protein